MDGDFRPMPPMVTGYIVMKVGCGHLTLTGAGRPSTMAAGSTMMVMAGCGYQDMNGHLHGLPGVLWITTTAGHHWVPEWV